MSSFCPNCGSLFPDGARFCANCGYQTPATPGYQVAYPQAAPKQSSALKITLAAVAGVLLLIVVGVGSLLYFVAHRVHQKIAEVRNNLEIAPNGIATPSPGSRDVCGLITKQELSYIYHRPFLWQSQDGNTCRYRPSQEVTYGVRLTVEPDLFRFREAVGQFHVRPGYIYGARGFFTAGTLFLSYNGFFLRITPIGGLNDAKAIAQKVLPKLGL